MVLKTSFRTFRPGGGALDFQVDGGWGAAGV